MADTTGGSEGPGGLSRRGLAENRVGLDAKTQICKYVFMRTTIDIPDELYRTLKVRAALSGVTMRDFVRRLVEIGLRQPDAPSDSIRGRREPPPVIIRPRRVPIPAIPRAELQRLEEEEDEAKHARSAGRKRLGSAKRS